MPPKLRNIKAWVKKTYKVECKVDYNDTIYDVEMTVTRLKDKLEVVDSGFQTMRYDPSGVETKKFQEIREAVADRLKRHPEEILKFLDRADNS